ncbi:MAG: hypothetical protein WCO54_00335 [Bacteroidota bacterium]
MFNKALSFIYFTIVLVVVAHAQNLTKSPYSAVGIGDLQFGGTAEQTALGQTAIGLRKIAAINVSNPASYSALGYTVVEAGFKYSEGTLSSTNSSSFIKNYSYGYLGVAVPLSKKLRWGMSFGLQPVSSVGYNIVSTVDYSSIPGGFPIGYQSLGSGGLSRFYFGSGIAVLPDLSLGFNFSYVWGQIYQTKTMLVDPSLNKYNIQETRSSYIGDIYFDFGLQYHKTFKDKYRLVVGSTVNLPSSMIGTQTYTARTMGVGGLQSSKDTVVFEGSNHGTVNLPLIIKTGISFEKVDEWLICADVNYSNWSAYNFFGQSDSLKNMLGVSVGASYIPSNFDYKNYLKRIEYRVGARYDNGYLNITGTDIATYGISAGMGFPLGRNKSKLNITGEYFVRGTTDNNLIKEEYWRIVFGITFSDKWFLRYKYN